MKPNRIILVRHGESTGNVDHTVYRHTPDWRVPLTERGEEQARVAGNEIKNIVGDETVSAYYSPFVRTQQTFAGIKSQLGDQLIKGSEDPRIREQEWGHYADTEERNAIIKERDAYGTFYYRFPDGESGADVYDRISTFNETLHRDFKKNKFGDNCLIVTHGLALRIFLMRWFHMPVERYEIMKNPGNCQIITLELTDKGKYKLVTELKWFDKPRHEQ